VKKLKREIRLTPFRGRVKSPSTFNDNAFVPYYLPENSFASREATTPQSLSARFHIPQASLEVAGDFYTSPSCTCMLFSFLSLAQMLRR
jgi:hypothetical protein